jgi:hypothetical protein
LGLVLVVGLAAAPFLAWGVNDVETLDPMVDASVGRLYLDELVRERSRGFVTEYRSFGIRKATYRYEAEGAVSTVELSYAGPVTGAVYRTVCREPVCLLEIDGRDLLYDRPLAVHVVCRDAAGRVHSAHTAAFELRKRKHRSSRFLDAIASV